MQLIHKKLVNYIEEGQHDYDIIFYMLFIIQVSILMSIPSSNYLSLENWIGFGMSCCFDLAFYPIFYFFFYRKKKGSYIRETVILSSVARIISFCCVGGIALVHIFFWSLLKFQKIPYTSLAYYGLYCLVFALIMVSFKKSDI